MGDAAGPAAPGPTVLVVEDDPAMAQVVAMALSARGYRVHAAATGKDALADASLIEPDLVVLDLNLPDLDGVDVCRQLRRWFAHPIVVLSADGAEDRKIAALDEGADDYVTKPFSMGELLARLRVADRHRKASASNPLDAPVLALGDLVVDVSAHVAVAGGEPVELTRKEFALLVALGRNPGRVLTHRILLERAWGDGGRGGIESLRVHVAQLRRKLGEGPTRPRIQAEPGVGYRLVVPEGAQVREPSDS